MSKGEGSIWLLLAALEDLAGTAPASPARPQVGGAAHRQRVVECQKVAAYSSTGLHVTDLAARSDLAGTAPTLPAQRLAATAAAFQADSACEMLIMCVGTLSLAVSRYACTRAGNGLWARIRMQCCVISLPMHLLHGSNVQNDAAQPLLCTCWTSIAARHCWYQTTLCSTSAPVMHQHTHHGTLQTLEPLGL
jgi:hypothetical protein